jgi:hypothetical protein
VIGTETGVLNALGMHAVPKIITLSHSSHEMLTKHWLNTTVLTAQNVKCHPCRMMHYDWTHCWKHEETGTAMCQYDISADRMWDAVNVALNSQRKAA